MNFGQPNQQNYNRGQQQLGAAGGNPLALTSRNSSRRDEILRARKQEKLRWQVLDDIRRSYDVDANDTRVQQAVTSVVEQTEQQLQGLDPREVVGRLVQFCVGELQSQDLLRMPRQNSSSSLEPGGGSNQQNPGMQDMYMPYNAKAGDVDPYAAIQIYQNEVARHKEEQFRTMEASRKVNQRNDLLRQMEENTRLRERQRVEDRSFDDVQRQQRKEYEKLVTTEEMDAKKRVNEERKKQIAYQESWSMQRQEEKERELAQDRAYLQRVENEIQLAKERDIQMLEQRRKEAEQTMIGNTAVRAARMAKLEQEKCEDKERMRQWEALENAKEARRRADLEAMKKHQAALMDIGNEAIEKQRRMDEIIEQNIQKAVEAQEEKSRQAQAASERARQNMIQDTNQWRQKEAESRQIFRDEEAAAEAARVKRMQDAFKNAEEEAARQKMLNARAKAQYKNDLMDQMAAQDEAKRRSLVEMSPHEAAVNQQVLSRFKRGDAMSARSSPFQRAGNNIIF
jgi:hypothetical protein